MREKIEYILITGASSGIGRAIAIGLSPDFNIILHGRDDEKLRKTKELCDQGKKQLIFKFDLERISEIEKELMNFISENEIEIIHFIHSAGFFRMSPLKTTSTDVINATFAINVTSAALIIKVLLQKKINNNVLKTIVLISSNVSNFGAKALSIYGASKGALDSMMRSLAVELAPKIRVNSILPGSIHTEMTKDIFENTEVLTRMTKEYPLGLGSTKDIFELVDFLISEKSRWITGHQFVVDGGRTINISG